MNKKVTIYDAAGIPVVAGKQGGDWPWVLAAICVIAVCVPLALRQRNEKVAESPAPGNAVFTEVAHAYCGNPKVSVKIAHSKENAILDQAIKAWGKEFSGRLNPRPELWLGVECNTFAFACADRDRNRIILSPNMATLQPSTFDLHSVFLHEIGHLLGVPHIEGDPLMSSVYTVPVTIPTAAAIALARIITEK